MSSERSVTLVFLSNAAAALGRAKRGLNSLIPFSQPWDAPSGSTRRAYRRAAEDATVSGPRSDASTVW